MSNEPNRSNHYSYSLGIKILFPNILKKSYYFSYYLYTFVPNGSYYLAYQLYSWCSINQIKVIIRLTHLMHQFQNTTRVVILVTHFYQ